MVYALAEQGICVSTGSACSAGAESPSHVLLAMGISYERAWNSIRASLSKYSTQEQVDDFTHACIAVMIEAAVLSGKGGSGGRTAGG